MAVERANARRAEGVYHISKPKEHQNRGVEKRGHALEERRSGKNMKSPNRSMLNRSVSRTLISFDRLQDMEHDVILTQRINRALST